MSIPSGFAGAITWIRFGGRDDSGRPQPQSPAISIVKSGSQD